MVLLIQKPEHKRKHQTKFMHALRTVVRFKELTGSRIEVLKFKIVWSFQGHAKSFCVPLLPPQDILREASRTSTHISKVEQLCISLLYQGPLQKETEEILLTQKQLPSLKPTNCTTQPEKVFQNLIFPAGVLRILLFPQFLYSEKVLLWKLKRGPHPLEVLRVCKHIVKDMVHICHLHCSSVNT